MTSLCTEPIRGIFSLTEKYSWKQLQFMLTLLRTSKGRVCIACVVWWGQSIFSMHCKICLKFFLLHLPLSIFTYLSAVPQISFFFPLVSILIQNSPHHQFLPTHSSLSFLKFLSPGNNFPLLNANLLSFYHSPILHYKTQVLCWQKQSSA